MVHTELKMALKSLSLRQRIREVERLVAKLTLAEKRRLLIRLERLP